MKGDSIVKQRKRWIPRECDAPFVLSYLRTKSLGQLAQT